MQQLGIAGHQVAAAGSHQLAASHIKYFPSA